MRGKALLSLIHFIFFRITPAYAGKSCVLRAVVVRQQDHPRLCGEKSGGTDNCTKMLGSPPPMRGKEVKELNAFSKARITPAYAGKSLAVGVRWIHDKDHPRLCGEKFQTLFCKVYIPGSPPPMRGKDGKDVFQKLPRRITPAYAGKSSSQLHTFAASWDHPRLCGEKVRFGLTLDKIQGSPPPMRGKVFYVNCILICCRITPAYAGKSFYHQTSKTLSWDHPRLCGEKFISHSI